MAPSTQFLSSDSEDDEYLRLIEELKKRHADELVRIESKHLVRKVAKAAERKRLVEEARCREEKEKQKAEEEKRLLEEAERRRVEEEKKRKLGEARRGREVVEQLECVEILPPGEKKTRKRQLLEQGGSPNKKVRQEAGRTMKGNIGEDGCPIKMGLKRVCKRCLSEGRECLPQGLLKSYACIACSESKQKCVLATDIDIEDYQDNIAANKATGRRRAGERTSTQTQASEVRVKGRGINKGLEALLTSIAEAVEGLVEELRADRLK